MRVCGILAWALAVWSAASAQARVEVLFLEKIHADGTREEMEPGSRFSHTVISYGDRWLSTHPYRGLEAVELSRLGDMGMGAARLVDEDRPAIDDATVAKLIGRPFDFYYDWSDDSKLYCAELIGKLLDVAPKPMTFSSPPWPEWYLRLNGFPGLSPQGLFEGLRGKGFVELPVEGS